MVPDRLWYRTDCVVSGLSVLMYRPGQLPGRASVISGELQAGGKQYMFMSDWSAFMTSQKATLDRMRTLS